MTTDSTTPTDAGTVDVPSLIAQLVSATHPTELVTLGIPICCVDEADMWAVPVRLRCGAYRVAFCRLDDAASVQLMTPSESVLEILSDSIRLPSLVIEAGALHVVVHTRRGDHCVPF